MSCLNEKLDLVVLEIFDQLEQLFEAQSSLEQVMKDGFFNMSRARYSLGVKRVSADQILEAELLASRTVTVSEKGSGEERVATGETLQSDPELETDKTSQPLALFSLHDALAPVTHPVAKGPGQKESISEDKSSELGLRKRNVKDYSNKDRPTVESTEPENKNSPRKKTAEGSDRCLLKDKSLKENTKDNISGSADDPEESVQPKRQIKPLNLFGILVPQELRTSQQKFEEAVSISVQVANLKHSLCVLQKQYKELRKAKV